MKCDLTTEDLRRKIIDNMNNCYDEYKDRMLGEFPDVIWENCHEIALHRDLYSYLLYKILHTTKTYLQYMQAPDMFEILKTEYYEGDYRPHHTDYARLLNNYIKKQQLMDMSGEME